jgi:hypothetical protein
VTKVRTSVFDESSKTRSAPYRKGLTTNKHFMADLLHTVGMFLMGLFYFKFSLFDETTCCNTNEQDKNPTGRNDEKQISCDSNRV